MESLFTISYINKDFSNFISKNENYPVLVFFSYDFFNLLILLISNGKLRVEDRSKELTYLKVKKSPFLPHRRV